MNPTLPARRLSEADLPSAKIAKKYAPARSGGANIGLGRERCRVHRKHSAAHAGADQSRAVSSVAIVLRYFTLLPETPMA